MSQATLYDRLGGYDGISTFATELLKRMHADPQVGRFWAHRSTDRHAIEKQVLIDYLCASAGGPMHYRGRDMKLAHGGMGINESDWQVFLGHAGATANALNVPQQEVDEVVAFVTSLKGDIVE